MSSDQEFFIKINDIIGKTWLATLDDSGGYVLSLKPIEQNNSSSVSPETEQERTTTLIENNSSNIANSENSENELNQPTNQELITESLEEYNAIKAIRRELCSEFSKNLLTQKDWQDFIEEINNNNLINSVILTIKYKELGESRNDKIINLIQRFLERGQIKQLQKIYYLFQKN